MRCRELYQKMNVIVGAADAKTLALEALHGAP